MAHVGARMAVDTLCMLAAVLGGGVMLLCGAERQAVALGLVCWAVGSAFRPPPEDVAAFRRFQLARLAGVRR